VTQTVFYAVELRQDECSDRGTQAGWM